MDPDTKQLNYKFHASRGSWPKDETGAGGANTLLQTDQQPVGQGLSVGGVTRRSSNQVEMLVGDLLVRRRMSVTNDNDDHSFVVAQQQQSACLYPTQAMELTEQTAAVCSQQQQQDSRGSLLLFCGYAGYNGNGNDGRLQNEIEAPPNAVESGCTLMKQKEVERLQKQQQQQQGRIVCQEEEEDNSQQEGIEMEKKQYNNSHQQMQLDQHQQQHSVKPSMVIQKSRPSISNLSLLKSPIFATNTLDESDLNKLASHKSDRAANHDERNPAAGDDGRGPLISYSTDRAPPPDEVVENHLMKQKQQQQQQQQMDTAAATSCGRQVTDCGGRRNSSTNMINRCQNVATSSCNHKAPSSVDLQNGGCIYHPTAGSAIAASTSTQSGSDDDNDSPAKQCRLAPPELSSVQQDCPSPMGVDSQATAIECDAADLERGGPTPTNDLIRLLIHRDRMALLPQQPQNQRPSEPSRRLGSDIPVVGNSSGSIEYWRQQLAASGNKHNYHQVPAEISSGQPTLLNISGKHNVPAAGANANANDSSSGKRGCWLQEPSPSSSTPSSSPPSTSCSQAKNCDDERNASLSAARHHQRRRHQRQEFDKCTSIRPKKAAAPEERRRPAAASNDLSALIGKCQRLQLSPPAERVASASDVVGGGVGISPYQLAPRALRSVSPRRPSDGLLKQQQQQQQQQDADKASANLEATTGQQRRHSAYLFPLLLNQAPTSDEESESEEADDYDEEEEGDADEDVGDDDDDGEEDDMRTDRRISKLLAGGCRRRKADKQAGRQVTGQDININNNNSSNNNNNNNNNTTASTRNNAKLRTSTSSPSALSTPTNELGVCGSGGGSNTGGGYAKHQQPASGQPAAQGVSAANMIQMQQQHRMRTRQGSGVNLRKLSAGSRKVSLASEQMVEQINRRIRRFESGPLDRIKLAAGMGAADESGGRPPNQRIAPAGRHLSFSGGGGAANRKASDGGGGRSYCGGGKRQSLISVLSGSNQASGGNQLVSRWLSHPRSLFSGHHSNPSGGHSAMQQSNPNSNPKLHRASVEGSTHLPSELEHYEPLIPESGFKIVVMGTSGSGKTSIIQRFAYSSFSWRHNPTVEDTYFIEFPYMKHTINISISDTSGTYQFPAMRRLAINSGDAFILVYSVDNPKSLDDIEQLRQSILDEREQAYSEACASFTSNDSSSSGLESGPTSSCAGGAGGLAVANTDYAVANSSVSPSRHWSLASIFSNHQHQLQQQQLQQEQQMSNHHLHHHATASNTHSLHSSICSSSCSSSADNSRRSSVSAAEIALKTRRTRHPPMVIVANKQDLPDEQHLVNSDEMEALVMIDWNNGFVRASAALNLNIDEIFQQVLKQAKQPPTMSEAIVSRRRKSLPPKLPQSTMILK